LTCADASRGVNDGHTANGYFAWQRLPSPLAGIMSYRQNTPMTKESPRENPYASPEVFGEQFRRAAAEFGQPTDGDAPIYAEGILSERDYMRTVRRAFRSVYWLGRIVILVLGAIYLWLIWRTTAPWAAGGIGWRQFALTRLPLLLVLGAGVALLLTRQTARFRKTWRASILRDERIVMRITPEVIEARRPSVYTLLRWTSYTGYLLIDDDLMVLASAHAANHFNIFPQSFFTPPDWERFIKLVAEKLPKK
jgi:hypothetical protein